MGRLRRDAETTFTPARAATRFSASYLRSLQLLPNLFAAFLLASAFSLHAAPDQIVCASCHPKEVAGYAQTGMARSIFTVTEAPHVPDGAFDHAASATKFKIQTSAAGMTQSMQSQDETTEQRVAFVIGSGNHAFGYLVQNGDHVFQSPLSYYTKRALWDVAPGYEDNPHPDFSRPIALECLLCHSDRPLPILNTVNRYQPAVFASLAISCDRCHGSAEEHLKKPIPGSIINPAKLAASERDSVCEQCHLKGEARIPNPGKQLTDFHAGQRTEDVFTTYVAARPDGKNIRVVSHVEQLARSMCARQSAGKLWCGTCHNPHAKPAAAESASYYRERCLTCHAAKLDAAHVAPGRDCVACHMPRVEASDGGHTVFTDHRIAREPAKENRFEDPASLAAWRPPSDPSLQRRNMALALASVGIEQQSIDLMDRSFQMLHAVEREFPDDPPVLFRTASLMLATHEYPQALDKFERLARLQDSAEVQTNLALVLLRLDRQPEAIQHLQKALSLDPLMPSVVNILSKLYRQQGQKAKAAEVQANYKRAMGISGLPPR